MRSMTMWVTTRGQISRSPDLVRRDVKSFIEGIQPMTTNPEVSKWAFRKYMRLQQERELDHAYQVLRGFMAEKAGYPTLEGFKAVFASWRNKFPRRKPLTRLFVGC